MADILLELNNCIPQPWREPLNISYRVSPFYLLSGTNGYRVPSHKLFLDCEAHVAGSAFDLAHSAFNIVGVHIFELQLGDLTNLSLAEGAHLGGLRVGRTLVEPCRLQDESGGRRGLEDEIE